MWSDEEDGGVRRVKFCSEEKLQPMSTKILIRALDSRSEEVEIDKDEVLAWYKRDAEERKNAQISASSQAEPLPGQKGKENNNGKINQKWLPPEQTPNKKQKYMSKQVIRITKTSARIEQQGDVLRLPNGVKTVFIGPKRKKLPTSRRRKSTYPKPMQNNTGAPSE